MIKNIFYIFIVLLGLLACQDQRRKVINTRDYCSKISRIGIDNSHTILSTDTLHSRNAIDLVTIAKDHSSCVYVLEEGVEALTARAYLSNLAQKTMDIQYFIFSEDNVGIISCDYMLRAACHGVKVRVLVDDLMLNTNPDYVLALDLHENIDIKVYNPKLNVGKSLIDKAYEGIKDFRGINQRMHHKTFIVDGQIAITGGRNIADEYFDFDHEYNFRDRDVLLIGGEATTIQSEFSKYWSHPLSVSISDLVAFADGNYSPLALYQWINTYAADSTNYWPEIRDGVANALQEIIASKHLYCVDDVRFYSDEPGKNDGRDGLQGSSVTTDTLITMIQNAQSSVYIQSPYLITTERGLDLFRQTVAKGVDIHIQTNSLLSTDNLEAFSGYQRSRSSLLDAGVHIYEYKPDALIRKKIMNSALQRKIDFQPIFGLHAKSMVIDNEIAVIGTFNLDPRSANLNTECITVIHSIELANDMVNLIKKELLPENSWKITQAFNPDQYAPTKKRVKAFTRRLIPTSVL